MIHGSFFSSIGLLDYGLLLAGHEAAWGCEADPYRNALWSQRFRAPCFDDIRGVGAANAERVDGIVGGFPCKGASTAGKRTGMDHPETVLWREMARAIGELEPRYVLVENVANILALHDGGVWGEVLGDLASLGFDVVWDCLPAAAVGAPHLRDRVFAIATHPGRIGRSSEGGRRAVEPRQRPARAHTQDAPDAGGDGLRDQPEPQRRGGGPAEPASAGEAASDPSRHAEGGAGAPSGADGERARPRARVDVEWGSYEPAIRRWEAVHGPAPEPLVRRVDDRGAARVERSRLSALGDGVQVQVGYLAGLHLARLEAERVRAAA